MKIERSYYIYCSFYFQPIVQTGLKKDKISGMGVSLRITMNASNHNTNLGHFIAKINGGGGDFYLKPERRVFLDTIS